MAATASHVSGIAGRYATALFEIAKDAGQLDQTEQDMANLEAALAESEDFRDLISSPIYARDEQASAIAAIAQKMGLGQMTTNTLGLMASNRRLFALPGLIAAVKALAAEERGEVAAEVTTAKPLSDAQRDALAATLKEHVGSNVVLNTAVDESLIGGMIVKVGSRMVDTSIRTKLASLQNVMKEAG
ncbi:MAG: F0F1 ATP synthase subunit delta [Pseudomonadota bacterium]